MKNCTPLWREPHFEVKTRKAHQVQSTFGSCDVKKTRRCGAKHISKSKVLKLGSRGAFFEVRMSTKRTLVEVKMSKTHEIRTVFQRSRHENNHYSCNYHCTYHYIQLQFTLFYTILITVRYTTTTTSTTTTPPPPTTTTATNTNTKILRHRTLH